jgi:DNA-binding transcriptional MerR regulator
LQNQPKIKDKIAKRKNMHKIGDAAKLLDVSGQTVKNWINAFPGSFSDSAKRNFGKRFNDQDLKRLVDIQTFRSDGRQLDEIKDMLPTVPEINYDHPPSLDQFSDMMRGPEVMTRRDAEALLEMLDATIQAKDEVIKAKEEIIRQHSELLLEKDRMHSQSLQDKNKWISELRGELDQLKVENQELKNRLKQPLWKRR